ncbi:tudor domain-containing protein 5 [Chanos chanos]|uniref:Tudor domain-containing protein 5 n=1 Tax=Chanos chanos TaxID=29144 RepID=A0A6J2WR26_CHACN|nr:tudor domain-containing protein 5 [Chanos chanos]
MTQEHLLAGLRKDVRSLLVSAKHGLAPEQLKRDYQKMLGYALPLKRLGFCSVLDMVKEMPDVVLVDYSRDGSILLKAVGDETTKGIEELVSKQRSQKPKASYHRSRVGALSFHYPHGGPPVLSRRHTLPTLPAQLRSQLRQLLSHGPIGLSELETKYASQFGRPLQITQYGFYSVAEMLAAASDLIAVRQSRTGSQLLLRNTVAPVKQSKTLTPRPSKHKLLSAINRLSPNTVFSNGQGSASSSLNVASPKNTHQDVLRHSSPGSESLPKPVRENQSFEKSVTKLEEELKHWIVENGDAGTVSQEVKEKLRKVVSETKEGLSIHSLPAEYKKMFGEDLPVTQCGFLSVTEMVGALSDTLCLQPDPVEGGNHWIVTELKDGDAETGFSQNEDSSASDLSESLSPPSKGAYFSCVESQWEGRTGEDGSSGDSEGVSELRISNKTVHQMMNIFPMNVLNCGSSVPLDAIQCQKLKTPTRRRERELVSVLVERVETPGHFYIRLSENTEARALENMMLEMRSCYSCPGISERYQLPDAYIRPGQVCCVTPRDIWFYRVVIHRVTSSSEVEVYYVDFGDVSKVNRSSLRFLKSCYAELPAQAVPSMLIGVKPVESSWTRNATNLFQKLCCERTLVAAIHGYQRDFLQVFLCDTHMEEDVYIHSALYDEGHAVLCSPGKCEQMIATAAQFNPVTLYLGEGQLDEVPEPYSSLTSSHTPNVQNHCSEIGYENNPSTNDQENLIDLPELEFIDVDEMSTLCKVGNANPFGALLCKQTENYSNWDEGWLPDSNKDETKTISVPASEDNEAKVASETQSSVSPSQAGSATLPHCGHVEQDPGVAHLQSTLNTLSLHTPGLGQTQSSETADLTSKPPHPVSPSLVFSLFGIRDGIRADKLFLRNASPLALSPAARLAAGSNLCSWYPQKMA